jgi:hypothetical protein
VQELDHHSWLLDNCVGQENRVLFLLALASLLAELTLALALLGSDLQDSPELRHLAVAALILALGAAWLAVLAKLGILLVTACLGVTKYEINELGHEGVGSACQGLAWFFRVE